MGKRKQEVKSAYDARFGGNGWSSAHVADGRVIDKAETLQHYEDGYFHFLRERPDVLEWLVKTASEVFDVAPSNVDSGIDYKKQECAETHLQDIAIRRVLGRLGRTFEGNCLVQIRGHESEGYRLNPGQVPFHKSELILPRDTKHAWWKPDSVEAFYQHNKALLVDPERLVVKPVFKGPEGTFFELDKATYYLADQSNARLLHMHKGRDVRRSVHEGANIQPIKDAVALPYSRFLGRKDF